MILGQGSSACCALQQKKKKKKTSYRATGGKYFQNTSDKEPVSIIYKVHSKFNNEETNNLISKWAKYVNRHFIKEDIEMANKSMKSCHHWLPGKCELKLDTLPNHRKGLKTAKGVILTVSSVNENAEQLELSCCLWESTWNNHSGKQFGSFL